ncbi:MAG: AIPR family protein [Simplicispira sp.]|nr:AIPR family protein [Simplicispira sp.]
MISLEDSPLDLAGKITTATNTQNKVEPKDFLALEDLQDGLAESFRKIGIQYCYRRGEKVIDQSKGLDVQELAMTLAVSSDSMSDVVMAKRNVGS